MGKLRDRPPEQEALTENFIETTIQGHRVQVEMVDDNIRFSFERFTAADEAEFMATYGSKDPDFVYGLLRQLASIGRNGRIPDEHGFKFALSVVRAIAPWDATEATLGAQMAAVHTLALSFANRLVQAKDATERESAERSLNRLLRTHCALVDTLNRYKNREDQKIPIQQASIAKRGQATVGNLKQRNKKPKIKEAIGAAAGNEIGPGTSDKSKRTIIPLQPGN